MRVTNSMISNSAQTHIGNAKSSLLKYEEQFTSEKKIQRPSDDPTVAVRSLKYRSTISQIKQYVEKNVDDCERPCRNAAGSFRSGKQQQNQRKNLAEPWRAFDAAERGRYKNELVGNSAKEEYVQADGNKI